MYKRVMKKSIMDELLIALDKRKAYGLGNQKLKRTTKWDKEAKSYLD